MWQVKKAGMILFTVAIVMQAVTTSVAATTFYVDDDASGNYTTIQDALNDSVSGDTIIVYPGTYLGKVSVDKSVTIKGASDYAAVTGGFNVYVKDVELSGLTIKDTVLCENTGKSAIIKNNKFDGAGVNIAGSSGYHAIINNSFNGGYYAVYAYNSKNNTINGNIIKNCDAGMLLLSGSGGHLISGNNITNCGAGIQLSYDSALIYNNYLCNKFNLQLDDDFASSSLNTTKIKDLNIIDGPYIGGNFWGSPSEDGFSQTHSDINGDGIAEEAYYINAKNIDYLPLVVPQTKPAPAATENNSTFADALLPATPNNTSRANTKIAARSNFDIDDSKNGSNWNDDLQNYSGRRDEGNADGSIVSSQKNIDAKELSQAFVMGGKTTRFNFTQNLTCVSYLAFDSKKTFGKTTVIVETLEKKSAPVLNFSEGKTYKLFSIQVGSEGTIIRNYIENPIICFKVEKSWMKSKDIDLGSVTLNWYNDKNWEQVSIKTLAEDANFIYYTASVPDCSIFAITGKIKRTPEQASTEEQEGNLPIVGSVRLTSDPYDTVIIDGIEKSTPDFETVFGVLCLFGAFLSKREGRR